METQITINKEDLDLFSELFLYKDYALIAFIKRLYKHDVDELLKNNKKVKMKLTYKSDNKNETLYNSKIIDTIECIAEFYKPENDVYKTSITKTVTLKDPRKT